jgi:hypothetical protein
MVTMVNHIVVATALGICRSGRKQQTAAYKPTEKLKS